MSPDKVMFGKHGGLTGRSGLAAEYGGGTATLHIAAPYDANDKIFVVRRDDDGMRRWLRMTRRQAQRAGLPIIRCSYPYCRRIAVMVGHHWPMFIEDCRCGKHLWTDVDKMTEPLELSWYERKEH